MGHFGREASAALVFLILVRFPYHNPSQLVKSKLTYLAMLNKVCRHIRVDAFRLLDEAYQMALQLLAPILPRHHPCRVPGLRCCFRRPRI